MPDAKGLRDIAVLLARPGEAIPATQLAGLVAPAGADPVLDGRARAAYKARLAKPVTTDGCLRPGPRTFPGQPPLPYGRVMISTK